MEDPVEPSDLAAAVSDLIRGQRPSRRPFPTVGDTTGAFDRLTERRPVDLPHGPLWVPAEFAHLGESWWRDHVPWYVVVDDIEVDVAALTVSSWPTLDSRHRLTFDEDSKHDLDVNTGWLHLCLGKCRTSVNLEGEQAVLATHIRGVGGEMRTRSVRVGDVYAVSNDALRMLRLGRGDWGREEHIIFDVTAHARDEAKIAFYAAASGSLEPEKEADRALAEVTWAERERVEGDKQPEEYA